MTDLSTHDTRARIRNGLSASSPARRFVRHYLEMVAAMFGGMIVLGVPAGWALTAFGSGTAELTRDAPAAMFLAMAATMTVPMVAWMRHRGHGWRPSAEMAASMLLPTFAAIALLASGAVGDVGALMAAEHVAMLAAMLAAMLLRVGEYTAHHHAGAEPPHVAAASA